MDVPGTTGVRGEYGIPGEPGTNITLNCSSYGFCYLSTIRGPSICLFLPFTGEKGLTGTPGERGTPGFDGIEGKRGEAGDPGISGNPGKSFLYDTLSE